MTTCHTLNRREEGSKSWQISHIKSRLPRSDTPLSTGVAGDQIQTCTRQINGAHKSVSSPKTHCLGLLVDEEGRTWGRLIPRWPSGRIAGTSLWRPRMISQLSTGVFVGLSPVEKLQAPCSCWINVIKSIWNNGLFGPMVMYIHFEQNLSQTKPLRKSEINEFDDLSDH